jgi:hypothetical protein
MGDWIKHTIWSFRFSSTFQLYAALILGSKETKTRTLFHDDSEAINDVPASLPAGHVCHAQMARLITFF